MMWKKLAELSKEHTEEALKDEDLTTLMFGIGALQQLAKKGKPIKPTCPSNLMGSNDLLKALVRVLDALVGEGLVEITDEGYNITPMGYAFDAQIKNMGLAVRDSLSRE